jgi:hypothetical protein
MRTLRLVIVSLLTLVALAVGVSPATAAQGCGTPSRCRGVSAVATGQGQFNADGSIDTTATATKDPLLKGTLAGHFQPTGGSSSDLSFAGDITLSTKKGTLTVDVTGAVSTATGDFQTSGPVTAGTGKFTGATGHLVFTGNQGRTGAFTETIDGKICLDKRHVEAVLPS